MTKFAACIRYADIDENYSNLLTLPMVLVDRAEVDAPGYSDKLEYVQIIPYIQVMDNDSEKILSYLRGSGGGEARLIDKRSIGFGGHVDRISHLGNVDTLTTETLRELEEELGIKPTAQLYTDIESAFTNTQYNTFHIFNSDVDAVHIGICLTIRINVNDITKLEKGIILDPQWHTLNELKQLSETQTELFENWSRVAIHLL